MLVHQSTQLECHLQSGNSDYLLITFAPLNDYADGSKFWAQGLATKAGISSLGFVATGPTWYPRDAMQRAISDVLPHISRWNLRLTYGASMGAYAALKYSHSLGATSAVALAPQFSLNTNDVPIEYNPHHQYFNSAIHAGMAINHEDLCSRCFVLYDPGFTADAVNAELISHQGDSVHLVEMLNCHHELARAFASTPVATDFLRTCLDREPADIRRMAHRARRYTPIRGFTIAEKLIPKHVTLSIKVFESVRSHLSDKYLFTYINNIIKSKKSTKEFEIVKPYVQYLSVKLRDNDSFISAVDKIMA